MMNGTDKVWEQALDYLRQHVPQEQFNTWIRPLVVSRDEEVCTVYVPNAVSLNWVSETYKDTILRAISRQKNVQSVELRFKIGNAADCAENEKIANGNGAHPSGNGRMDSGKKLNGAFTNRRLNADYTFDSYVEGGCNAAARAAAERVVDTIGNHAHNPFLICGGVGLGKTHLMQAIGHAIGKRYRNKRVVYCTSENFVNNMVRSLQHGTMEKFKGYYRDADVLLIDDVQFFVGKEKCQEEVFQTIDQVRENQGQLVLTCDSYPNKIRGLEARLRSRLNWGLTAEIDMPALETRAAIVLKKASHANCVLSEKVALAVAEHVESNVRELEGALHRLMSYARRLNAEITPELVAEAMTELQGNNGRVASLPDIKKATCHYYNIQSSDLVSHKRSASLVRPRHMAMYLSRKLTRNSLPEIGDSFGGRDHTSVMYACRNIEKKMAHDEDTKTGYKSLMRLLSE